MRQPRANHRYLKRYMGPNGKWVYVYAKEEQHNQIRNIGKMYYSAQSDANTARNNAAEYDRKAARYERRSERYQKRAESNKEITNAPQYASKARNYAARKSLKYDGEAYSNKVKADAARKDIARAENLQKTYASVLKGQSVSSQVKRKIRNAITRVGGKKLMAIKTKKAAEKTRNTKKRGMPR